ncbi:MAG: ATP-binding protein [Bryobacteraceae bacterium]
MDSSRADPRIALPWIVRLRYAMAAGQAITCFAADQMVGIDLPLRWLLIPPALVALSNPWLSRHAEAGAGRDHSTLIGWVFVLDTLCLTATLMLAGGPNNPFSLLYLVHITLAATILNQRQTWALGALACVCFGLLFWNPMPIPALEMHPHGGRASLHLIGMWVAFGVASALVAMFSGRISALLREREQTLLRMQEELAKKERLASLVTLAAGAAHELSTPLGTIAVVAKELEHYATRTSPNGAIADDSRLIRQEVDRCRAILQGMSLAGAEPVGEALEDVTSAELLAAVRDVFTSRLEFRAGTATDAVLRIPRHAVEQALIALVKNAFDASAEGAVVRLSARTARGGVCFEVIDEGAGMSAETLRRAGEPFFTTKAPGAGMGLGIFLVRTLADRLQGRFELTPAEGGGTRAILELPCQTSPAQIRTESRV